MGPCRPRHDCDNFFNRAKFLRLEGQQTYWAALALFSFEPVGFYAIPFVSSIIAT